MIESMDEVPLIVRREIEARIIAPFVESLSARFGRQPVIEALRDTIQAIARQQGSTFASSCDRADLPAFAGLTQKWQEAGALEMKVLRQDEGHLDFDVTRCRYAEMYQRLGIPELGRILSCGRDFAVSEGFSPSLHLTRTQTLLEGTDHCDFRYRLENQTPDH